MGHYPSRFVNTTTYTLLAQLHYQRQGATEAEYRYLHSRNIPRSNNTRWNSIYKELRALLSNRAAIQAFFEAEREAATVQPKKPKKGAATTPTPTGDPVLDNPLTEDDWNVLQHYNKLLLPCYVATMDLQGQAGDDKPCALFNVQSDIEVIVQRLTDAWHTYKDAPDTAVEGEWHFRTQIRLALDKAQQYYARLDDSPAYVASAMLHPGRTLKYFEGHWSGHKAWIKRAKDATTSLWLEQYKQPDRPTTESPVKHRAWQTPELNLMEEYRLRGMMPAISASKAAKYDELEQWFKEQIPQQAVTNPLEWWRTTGSTLYPDLTQMALDLLSIPAMSDEPERLFSRLGLIITPRRNHLKQETVQAIVCLHSWDKHGLINIKQSTMIDNHDSNTTDTYI